MDKRAIEILRALACDYQQQIALFPDYVPTASELASCFSDLEDIYLMQSGITKETALNAHIAAIKCYIDDLQEMPTEESWSNEALKNSTYWSNIRLEARAALAAIGENEMLAPDLAFLKFLPDKTQLPFAHWRNKGLLIAYAARQFVFLGIITGWAWVHFSATGEWVGWPLIIATAVLLNIAWCFVA